jgi:uncharacterized protein
MNLAILGLAAVAAGVLNALAGGGTLIVIPLLVLLGAPAVTANVTVTVALCPGYLGAAWGQRRDLQGQGKRLALVLPASVLGGLVGGVLLLASGEALFRALAPLLILLAVALLALQPLLGKHFFRPVGGEGTGWRQRFTLALGIGLAAVYGGYFGAGLSVIVLAVLALGIADSLTRLNGLKQVIGLAANVAGALLFVFTGQVLWLPALVIAIGALAGGAIGGRLAGRIDPDRLRWTIVGLGTLLGGYFLWRGFG